MPGDRLEMRRIRINVINGRDEGQRGQGSHTGRRHQDPDPLVTLRLSHDSVLEGSALLDHHLVHLGHCVCNLFEDLVAVCELTYPRGECYRCRPSRREAKAPQDTAQTHLDINALALQ